MRKLYQSIFLITALFAKSIFAAPPYITDDAEPAEFHELQIYPFAQVDITQQSQLLVAPALELDYGILPNTEIHLILAMSTLFIHNSGNAMGISDTELGIKYQILNQKDSPIELAFAPMFEVPTGSSDRNLGNGGIWLKIPFWVQKRWDTWTIHGGLGYVYNSAPGMENYLYGGITAEHALSDKLTVGGEFFGQGTSGTRLNPLFPSDEGYILMNFGFTYQLTKNMQVLASAGRSFLGMSQWVGYAGFFISIM